MNKPVFSNEININETKKSVMEVLKNPEKILNKIPEIENIKIINDNQFEITRPEPALNTFERINFTSDENSIKFTSTEGRFSYDLIFELNDKNGTTAVTENLYSTSKTKLPLSLLAPIGKNAFNRNLQALKNIIENKKTIL